MTIYVIYLNNEIQKLIMLSKSIHLFEVAIIKMVVNHTPTVIDFSNFHVIYFNIHDLIKAQLTLTCLPILVDHVIDLLMYTRKYIRPRIRFPIINTCNYN